MVGPSLSLSLLDFSYRGAQDSLSLTGSRKSLWDRERRRKKNRSQEEGGRASQPASPKRATEINFFFSSLDRWEFVQNIHRAL